MRNRCRADHAKALMHDGGVRLRAARASIATSQRRCVRVADSAAFGESKGSRYRSAAPRKMSRRSAAESARRTGCRRRVSGRSFRFAAGLPGQRDALHSRCGSADILGARVERLALKGQWSFASAHLIRRASAVRRWFDRRPTSRPQPAAAGSTHPARRRPRVSSRPFRPPREFVELCDALRSHFPHRVAEPRRVMPAR